MTWVVSYSTDHRSILGSITISWAIVLVFLNLSAHCPLIPSRLPFNCIANMWHTLKEILLEHLPYWPINVLYIRDIAKSMLFSSIHLTLYINLNSAALALIYTERRLQVTQSKVCVFSMQSA